MGTLHVVAAATLQNWTGARRTRFTLLTDDGLCLSLFLCIRPFVGGAVDGGQVGIPVGKAILMATLLTNDLRWLRFANLSVFTLGTRPMVSVHLVEFEASILGLCGFIHQAKDICFGDWHPTQAPFLLVMEARRIHLAVTNRRNEIIRQTLPTKRMTAGREHYPNIYGLILKAQGTVIRFLCSKSLDVLDELVRLQIPLNHPELRGRTHTPFFL